MSKRRTPILFLAAGLLATVWGAARPAAATTYVAMADEELFDRSPLVVEGRVLALEAASVEGVPAIDYRVGVDRVVKGGPPQPTLTVRVPGGVRADGVGLKIWGAPRFRPGEEVLLFLEPQGGGIFGLHQFSLGAFHVERSGAHEVAWRDLDEAHEIVPAGGKRGSAGGLRELAAFREWLFDRGRGRLRPADYFLPEDEFLPGDELLPEDELPVGSEGEVPEKFALAVSTTDPPPLGCGDDGGHPVRWFAGRSGWPVVWRFHVDGQRGLVAGGLPDYQKALLAWGEDPNTPVSYLHLGGTSLTNGFEQRDNVNAVVFGDPNDEIGGDFVSSGILAIGGPWFLCETDTYAGEEFHPIVEADIVLQDGVETFFDSLPDSSLAGQELFAHELGHTLGLAHTPRRDALMRVEIHADGRGAALDLDDLAGVFFLYGRPDLPIDTDGPPFPSLPLPERPEGLAARVFGFDRVRLTWTDTSSNESNFRVERRRQGELNFELAGMASAGREEFLDTVEPGAAYTYRVLAQNGAGRSRPSALARVEVPEDPRPRAPSDLRTAAVSSSSIRLTWQDRSENETGFAIDFRSDGDWKRVRAVVPQDLTSVELQGLTPGTAFTFRVRSVNDHGESVPSNKSTAATFPDEVTCVSRGPRLCLANGRFVAEVEYQLPESDSPSAATVVPLTGRTGLFWFFSAGNPEVVVRLLDDPGEEDVRIAVSGLSSLEYRVMVTDSSTGVTRKHHHPAGGFCEGKRVLRFPRTLTAGALTPGPSPRGRGEPGILGGEGRDSESLTLFEGRFEVAVERLGEDDALDPALALAGPGETGLFSFGDPSEPDVIVKVLDAGRLNGRFWVLSSPPLRPDSYRLTVTDTVSGERRLLDYAAGSRCGLADFVSFAVE